LKKFKLENNGGAAIDRLDLNKHKNLSANIICGGDSTGSVLLVKIIQKLDIC